MADTKPFSSSSQQNVEKLKGYCLESKDGIIQSQRDDRISQRASQINKVVLRFKETNIYFNGSYYVVVEVIIDFTLFIAIILSVLVDL